MKNNVNLLRVEPATIEDIAAVEARIRKYSWNPPGENGRTDFSALVDPDRCMLYRSTEDLEKVLPDLRVLKNGTSESVGNGWLRYFLKPQDPNRVPENLRELVVQQNSYIPAAELCSFVVDEEFRLKAVDLGVFGYSPSKYFIDRIVEELQGKGIQTLFALSRKPEVFENLGFAKVAVPSHLQGRYDAKMITPLDLKTECNNCILRPCPEVPIVIPVNDYRSATISH